MAQDDIPKRVILVLLILTIVVSVLGTWTVLDAVSSTQPKPSPSQTEGNVEINILPSNTVLQEPAPQLSESQGVVGLTIVK
jgi:heme/copper-type cytochrome/quinol oxidase subunit 2